jgi:hypothetical protein
MRPGVSPRPTTLAVALALWVMAALLGLPARSRVPPTTPEVPASGDVIDWQVVAPGMEYGEWLLPWPAPVGDRRLRVVRLDPSQVSIQLKTASRDGPARTLPEWAAGIEGGAVAMINASMFDIDDVTSVGLMIDDGHVNNAALAADHNSLLAAGSRSPADAGARLYNLGCEDLEHARAHYRTLVQSIRMLGCDGENVWSQQPRRWSAALVGQDRAGRILFLLARTPYTMHDLVEQLRGSPLELVALHYGDGGPPAAMYLRVGEREQLWLGSYETGVQEDDRNDLPWALPNVLYAVAEGAGEK